MRPRRGARREAGSSQVPLQRGWARQHFPPPHLGRGYRRGAPGGESLAPAAGPGVAAHAQTRWRGLDAAVGLPPSLGLRAEAASRMRERRAVVGVAAPPWPRPRRGLRLPLSAGVRLALLLGRRLPGACSVRLLRPVRPPGRGVLGRRCGACLGVSFSLPILHRVCAAVFISIAWTPGFAL